MSKAQQKWDKRYLDKGEICLDNLPEAPETLRTCWPSLKTGRVLDLGAGDGACALFLAQQGFEVCAVDISAIGLSRLQNFAEALDLNVSTQVMDLESNDASLTDSFAALGTFDSIIVSRYKPADFIWPLLVKSLKSKGNLWLSTFNQSHHANSGFPLRFCLRPKEYAAVSPKLKLLFEDSDIDEICMDTYLFEKQGNSDQ